MRSVVSTTFAPSIESIAADDRLAVLEPGRVDGDVAQRVGVVEVDQVYGADRPSGLADRARYEPQHAGLVGDSDADDQ